MSRFDRYLKVCEWARKRYTRNGILIIDRGGVPTTYARIEEAAFEKYIRHPRDEDGCLIFKA